MDSYSEFWGMGIFLANGVCPCPRYIVPVSDHDCCPISINVQFVRGIRMHSWQATLKGPLSYATKSIDMDPVGCSEKNNVRTSALRLKRGISRERMDLILVQMP